MKILNVQPRDVHIVLELSSTELTYVLEYLSVCVANPDRSSFEKFEKAAKFVEHDFFKGLDKLSEDIRNEFGPDSAQG
jgi:hypothetical protein